MAYRIKVRSDGETVAHAFVDFEDRDRVMHGRWTLDRDGYVCLVSSRAIRLHRVVLELEPGDGLEADHIDGDKLNCCRSNLRIATRQQNGQNVPARRGVRGVFFDASRRTDRNWRVRPCLNGKSIHVGWFATEGEATVAADAWYAEHMPFANLERHRAPA